MTAYLLESLPSSIQEMSIQIKNGNILLLLSSLFVSSSTKESQKFILRRNFPALVASKTSKFVTKEISLLLPQTPWQSMR